MTVQSQVKQVVLDATVLINLMDTGQLDILPRLKGFEFWTPNHVKEEVHRRSQRLKLRRALKAGWIKEVEIVDISEIELYAEYRRRFGPGESACMAVARSRGWIAASDDRAVKREVITKFSPNFIADTKWLLDKAVENNLLERSHVGELYKRLKF